MLALIRKHMMPSEVSGIKIKDKCKLFSVVVECLRSLNALFKDVNNVVN